MLCGCVPWMPVGTSPPVGETLTADGKGGSASLAGHLSGQAVSRSGGHPRQLCPPKLTQDVSRRDLDQGRPSVRTRVRIGALLEVAQ